MEDLKNILEEIDWSHRVAVVGRQGGCCTQSIHRVGAIAILPGSFNPVHQGHWQLAEAAARLTGKPVAFELSVANVDKPDLSVDEVLRRVAQFRGKADLWITRAATFVEKACIFPEAVFVVGADTAERVIAPRYYGQKAEAVQEALSQLRQRACRFLVGGRLHDGCFRSLEDLPIPEEFGDLFLKILPDQFRCDVSSTELRSRTVVSDHWSVASEKKHR